MGGITKRRPRAYFTEHLVADRMAPAMRLAFLRAIQQSRLRLSESQLAAIWTQGPQTVFGAIPWRAIELDWLDGFTVAILATVVAAGRAQMAHLHVEKQRRPIGTLGFSFDQINPRAVRWAEDHAADLVVRLSEETKAAIRRQIVQMFNQGIPPEKAARLLRERLGLTPRDAQAVENLSRKLELDNAQRLVDGKKLVPLERLEAQTERYADHLLAARAEVIVRTESIRASAQGQQELWTQAEEQGYLQKEDTRRAWLLTPDERLCPICEPMATDEKLVTLDQPFVMGDGSLAENPPAHPQCRCAVGLVFLDAQGEFHHPQA